MPRRPPIYSDFYYNPLTEDVEELLARFQQTESVRYTVFSAIWREMGFSDVFIGISHVGEMKRFCRIAMATAMKYFLPPYSYQIRVGGLYLMFGFYNTQLAISPVKIRLALKDWNQVQKFIKDSVQAGHHDVLYIYHKLVATKAMDYTAMPHFLTFQKQRKPKKESVCAEFLGRTTAVQDLISSNILEEVTNMQSQYEKLKEATVEVSCKVTMTHRDFVSRMKGCMSEFITWQQRAFSQDNKDKNAGDDEEKPAEDQHSSSTRARLLSSIKDKSYSSFQEASKSRRHRKAETVDATSSGAELVQETATVRKKKRPPSLRARTWKSLRVTQEKSKLQAWLLSVPEKQDRVPVKRDNQVAPFRP
ncbi:snRNA-activating protein complex subunit 1-like [Seriola dumerili]|uniref:snRNA-activating protein complex subunit 1-like n=1 Tax=Seriola dumerili TaxID=41447 RepID=A0A3B4TUN7_SERDU|nr:snRNA-activating protein complex subunit 1-like [Seriola dumerili]